MSSPGFSLLRPPFEVCCARSASENRSSTPRRIPSDSEEVKWKPPPSSRPLKREPLSTVGLKPKVDILPAAGNREPPDRTNRQEGRRIRVADNRANSDLQVVRSQRPRCAKAIGCGNLVSVAELADRLHDPELVRRELGGRVLRRSRQRRQGQERGCETRRPVGVRCS